MKYPTTLKEKIEFAVSIGVKFVIYTKPTPYLNTDHKTFFVYPEETQARFIERLNEFLEKLYPETGYFSILEECGAFKLNE